MLAVGLGLATVAMFCFGYLLFGYKFSKHDNQRDFLDSENADDKAISTIVGAITTALSVVFITAFIVSLFGE